MRARAPYSTHRLAGPALLLALAVSAQAAPVRGSADGTSRPGPAAAATDLDRFVATFELEPLARTLASMPPSADRDYFAGVLANRENRLADSVPLLERALPELKRLQPARAAIALRTLADDFVKLYRYADALRPCAQLHERFGSYLDRAARRSSEDDCNTVRLLRRAPPQTVSFDGPVDLATQRNRVLGTLDTTLSTGGVSAAWILDTGANFSAVSSSFARRLGLRLSKDTARTQGITGAENELRVAVLPELRLGGATVRDAVLLVLSDEALNVPAGRSRYQIEAVLGYPVLQALGRLTFTADGHLLAGPGSPSADGGAPLYMNWLMPLVECEVQGRRVPFSLDTGADASLFSARFAREFPDLVRDLPRKPHAIGGAGGVRELSAVFLPDIRLVVGATTATLHEVPVLPELGTDLDKVFGNLGRDLTDPYRRFTVDFAAMRFRLGEQESSTP
jgi:predicted aspartyl protease